MSKLATAIAVDHAPTAERLAALGVHGWPIWTKEVSSPETCCTWEVRAAVRKHYRFGA